MSNANTKPDSGTALMRPGKLLRIMGSYVRPYTGNANNSTDSCSSTAGSARSCAKRSNDVWHKLTR